MPMTSGMYSSNTSEWETPDWLFVKLDNEFKFTLDSCATIDNAKVKNFISPDDDALIQPWHGRVFMNPPYGREIGKWVAKAYEEARTNAAVVVCLLPSRTDTSWWHDYCMKGELRFLRGRLKFSNSKNSAPFPSVVVIFRR